MASRVPWSRVRFIKCRAPLSRVRVIKGRVPRARVTVIFKGWLPFTPHCGISVSVHELFIHIMAVGGELWKHRLQKERDGVVAE